jgi:CHAT domain-containing protein/Tfp pilus assembly protein PilF
MTKHKTSPGSWGRLAMVGLALLAAAWAYWPLPLRAQGKEQAKELTKEERAKLQKEALELNEKAFGLYQRGKLVEATGLFQRSLAIFRKLYPPERFPQGHPDLATGLNNLGALLSARGEYAQTEPLYRAALAMYRKLYPKERFPKGHPDLATSLNNLGFLLWARGEYAQAEPFLRAALAMRRKFYPPERFPQGHPHLAQSLHNLGSLLRARAEHAQAEPLYRDALAMYRKLYPKERFPQGHPDLASSLNNLGLLLQARGEYAQAEPFFRAALAMDRKLYPKERFPNGHPHLAGGLHNLGGLLKARGEYAQAEPFCREALAMTRKLYPKERFPNGHPHLAASLANLGLLLLDDGKYAQAEPFCREGLVMCHKLYSPERFPKGHPDLAHSLTNLGLLLVTRGDYAQAEPFFRDALDMKKKLYPKERFPQGHPDLANSLSNLGSVLYGRGKYAEGSKALAGGLAMYQDQANLFAQAHAEAESLNFLAILPPAADAFLSVTREASGPAASDAYPLLWRGKAVLARVLERRQHLLHVAPDTATRTKVSELLDVRQQLARLLLTPATGKEDKDRPKRLRRLTERKENLEKELAQKFPALVPTQAAPSELATALPGRAAFIDLFRYRYYKQGSRTGEAHYVAFVLAKGKTARRVELGPAVAIEKALAQWRQDIKNHPSASTAAPTLRRLLWKKLAEHLPVGTDTVYLCPDGALSALPWAALPGRQAGTVLLEEYALALVPHGPFLLEQLTRPGPADTRNGTLLALGGVLYDKDPEPVAKLGENVALLRPADRSSRSGTWPVLPGTARELDRIVGLAGKLAQPPKIIERRGTAASTGQLLLDMPRARWAHLATHGYFAAPGSDARKYLYDEKDFIRGLKGERRGVGARNPLTQTGLVLAGANRAKKDEGDNGILTAEGIAGLALDKLELAVLSACETGLGEAATGEGVFGLKRAFHLAGARNVVASLWKVDDEATAALMVLLYHYLWQEKQPPLTALRKAQLALYRHPKDIATLAKGPRGPNFAKTVKRVTLPAKEAKPAAAGAMAPVKSWAAFVLSGAGR